MPVSDQALKRIAIIGAFAALGGAGVIKTAFERKVRKQPYYQEAANILKNSPAAHQVLGEPVSIGQVDVGHRFQVILPHHAKIVMYVSGPRDRGLLFVEALKGKEASNNWEIVDLTLKTDNHKDKALRIFHKDTNGPIDHVTKL